ncbi:hypothetical protein [Halomarina ordinaria]|uniref:Sulfatase-like hydrolase/transferase n=1 Tax=Halomarina ordinaria TaxID=3033939 RepID=A0ABD5UCF1_9EURY|nr:hypothetical protein [Halomarina sp. PSRA2]
MKQLLSAASRNLRYAGVDAVREVLWRTYLSVRPRTPADPVLDADWDLLVVLDACRADLFETVVADGDYDFEAGQTRISPGSSSVEWLAAVFGDAPPGALADLGYVTANPYSEAHLDAEAFGLLDEVWRDAWDADLGTVPPRPVTDRAVAAAREAAPDRLVVHYMQPHFPAIATGTGERRTAEAWGDEPMSIWEDLRFGGDADRAWADYRANLELVLEEVTALLSNVDADRAVVTADHGNAFGERHIYGHPGGVDLPCLREVPWCETSATDRGTRTVPTDRRSERTTVDADAVDARLRSLGYRT